jgi:hypothetical protein
MSHHLSEQGPEGGTRLQKCRRAGSGAEDHEGRGRRRGSTPELREPARRDRQHHLRVSRGHHSRVDCSVLLQVSPFGASCSSVGPACTQMLENISLATLL